MDQAEVAADETGVAVSRVAVGCEASPLDIRVFYRTEVPAGEASYNGAVIGSDIWIYYGAPAYRTVVIVTEHRGVIAKEHVRRLDLQIPYRAGLADILEETAVAAAQSETCDLMPFSVETAAEHGIYVAPGLGLSLLLSREIAEIQVCRQFEIIGPESILSLGLCLIFRPFIRVVYYLHPVID